MESGYSKIRLRPKSYDFLNVGCQTKTPLVYTDRNNNTFGNNVMQPNLRKKEFGLLNQIAKVIPIYELETTDNLLFLPKQCEIIIANFDKNNYF